MKIIGFLLCPFFYGAEGAGLWALVVPVPRAMVLCGRPTGGTFTVTDGSIPLRMRSNYFLAQNMEYPIT